MWSHIKEHLRNRFVEWVIGAGLLVWGIIVYNNPQLFDRIPFSGLKSLASSYTWGLVAAGIGFLRLVFLFINGTLRQSAHMRAIGSAMSACVWGTILGTYISLDETIPNLGSIGALLVLDIYCLWFAVDDARKADTDRKEDRQILRAFKEYR